MIDPNEARISGDDPPASPSVRDIATYFAWLGSVGFGGPIALVGHMHRDLVELRRWVTADEYREGLALAQLAPGPLAAQLAIYLGWVRRGLTGATVAGFAFVAPSFVMVMALSALYVAYGGMAWIAGAFYGVAAAVIAIIARSAVRLARTTLRGDAVVWLAFAANAVATAWTGRELVWLVFLCGPLVVLARGRWRFGSASLGAIVPVVPLGPLAMPEASRSGPHALLALLAGVSGSADRILQILVYFAKAGMLVFGSGLAIIPYLYGGVVSQMRWLTEQQFLDAVAVSMITPGPVVITVSFIGYLVSGPMGAIAAAVGVFLPVYLVVVIAAPYFHRAAASDRVYAFVDGLTAGALGALAGAVVVLGQRAVVDLPTAAIAIGTLGLLSLRRRIPEVAIIGLAGAVGITLRALQAQAR